MIPDSIEPITAYRAFHLHKAGFLKSTGMKEELWQPGENEAACLADIKAKWVRKNVNGELKRVKVLWHGLIPEPRCECGFWMLNTSQAVVDYFFGPRQDWMFAGFFRHEPMPMVVAEVKGWGRVIQAENGYRTEFASVSALLDGPTVGATDVGKLVPSPLIHKLAEKYGVPVVQPDYEFPQPKPAEAGPSGDLIAWGSPITYTVKG